MKRLASTLILAGCLWVCCPAVAQESLDNMENGPLLILGGKRAFDMAVQRSQLDDRAGLIATIATPRRENIPSVKA